MSSPRRPVVNGPESNEGVNTVGTSFAVTLGFYNVGMRSLSAPTLRMTRRRLAVLLGATPLAAQIATPPVTQKTPPLGTPTPSATTASPEEKLKKESDAVRETSARLAKLEVPMDTEPAFVFKP
ncbi:MAG: hypothetical protein ACJ746_22200 [Bryobacteraceae bacterium]